MNAPITFFKASTGWALFFAVPLLFVRCAGDDRGADRMEEDAADRSIGSVEPVHGADLDDEVNVTYSEQAAADRTHGNASSGTMTTTTVVVYTPAKERMMITNDMRGLRSLLMADLEAVRARLNDGARPQAARDADVALAADLAQGLERVDRALAALGATNDVSWTTIRDAQVKEVAEVRSWMADYRSKGSWAMN
ncbi:MAG: hypothetical protein ACO1NQ_00960 [Flavobacteriales bacterium]